MRYAHYWTTESLAATDRRTADVYQRLSRASRTLGPGAVSALGPQFRQSSSSRDVSFELILQNASSAAHERLHDAERLSSQTPAPAADDEAAAPTACGLAPLITSQNMNASSPKKAGWE